MRSLFETSEVLEMLSSHFLCGPGHHSSLAASSSHLDNSSGVYICKSIVNNLRHGKYICKSEENYPIHSPVGVSLVLSIFAPDPSWPC